jgi:hypothetical protein
MQNKINESGLAGKKFGLLAIQKAWRNSKKDIIARCLCECGRTYQGRYAAIKAGRTKSCGCLNTEKNIKEWRNWSINSERKGVW